MIYIYIYIYIYVYIVYILGWFILHMLKIKVESARLLKAAFVSLANLSVCQILEKQNTFRQWLKRVSAVGWFRWRTHTNQFCCDSCWCCSCFIALLLPLFLRFVSLFLSSFLPSENVINTTKACSRQIFSLISEKYLVFFITSGASALAMSDSSAILLLNSSSFKLTLSSFFVDISSTYNTHCITFGAFSRHCLPSVLEV